MRYSSYIDLGFLEGVSNPKEMVKASTDSLVLHLKPDPLTHRWKLKTVRLM